MLKRIFLFVCLTVFLGCPCAIAKEPTTNSDDQNIIWSAVLLRQTGTEFCSEGQRGLVSHMGDIYGSPLSLKYVDASQPSYELIRDPREDEKAWTEWNKSLVNAIDKAFSNLPSRAKADDKLVVARARFDVSRSGKVKIVNVVNLSGSEEFGKMIATALQSLDGQSSLRFPKGTKFKSIQKQGRFSQNYGSTYIREKRPG